MTRAERRYRKERVVLRTIKYLSRKESWWVFGDRKRAPDDIIRAKKMADNRKCCAHPNCCNPRRHFGKLTFQEKKFFAIPVDES